MFFGEIFYALDVLAKRRAFVAYRAKNAMAVGVFTFVKKRLPLMDYLSLIVIPHFCFAKNALALGVFTFVKIACRCGHSV